MSLIALCDRWRYYERYLCGNYWQHVKKNYHDFRTFYYRNFHYYERYKDMQPDSNQLARLYGTAKTHKFETLEDVTVANLKFRPVID